MKNASFENGKKLLRKLFWFSFYGGGFGEVKRRSTTIN